MSLHGKYFTQLFEALNEKVTCKRCGGTGTSKKTTDKYATLDNCPTCKGKGFLESALAESFGINTFVQSYIETALWSSTDESTPSGGEPLDKNYGPEDVAPEAVSKMKQDCENFVRQNEKLLDACGLSDKQAGHCFWLNRNGHGTGFWDRAYDTNDAVEKAALNKLSDASKRFGECDLYVGDDGKIYVG